MNSLTLTVTAMLMWQLNGNELNKMGSGVCRASSVRDFHPPFKFARIRAQGVSLIFFILFIIHPPESF